jgi:hypothetical protein
VYLVVEGTLFNFAFTSVHLTSVASRRRKLKQGTSGYCRRLKPPPPPTTWDAGAGRTSRSSGGDLRRFSTQPHPGSGGLDLHARTMALGVLHHAGAILRPRPRQAGPAPLLQAIAPDRDARGGGACRCPGAWLGDLGAQAGLPVVLGHARSMQAIPGGQAKPDQRAPPTLSVRRRTRGTTTGHGPSLRGDHPGTWESSLPLHSHAVT